MRAALEAGLAGALLAVSGLALWQHGQLDDARQGLAEASTALTLCQTDKATLAQALEDHSAEVAAWKAWADGVRARNAEAMARAAERREELEAALEAALARPAGTCVEEAEELGRWFDSLR